MTEQVGPANITAAALVMQFFLSAIISFGAWRVWQKQKLVVRFWENPRTIATHAWVLLLFALATVGILITSDQFYAIWRPMSGDVNFSLFGWSHALLAVFLIDILCCAFLVFSTGGSYQSPFAPVYFILPAMGFFLRQSPRRVMALTLFISVVFLMGFGLSGARRDEDSVHQGAYAFVSMSCLILSVLIGYLTRPQ